MIWLSASITLVLGWGTYAGQTNWTYTTQLAAFDGAAGDEFGDAVAVRGDIIAVGAPLDDGTYNASGAAYVFRWAPTTSNYWSFVAKCVAPDAGAEHQFGSGIDTDGSTLVVGAPGFAGYRGAAYVFGRDVGGVNGWGFVTNLLATDGVANDEFGNAVAVDGNTIVVGARQDNGSDGAAYVFQSPNGAVGPWLQTKRLADPLGYVDARFGRSVTVRGDTMIVGADDGNFAQIFVRHNGGVNNWGAGRRLLAPDASVGDDFGKSVAMDGDLIVVGAIYDETGGFRFRGSAYVFARNAGGAGMWGNVDKLLAADGRSSDWFGDSVAVENDTIVIGAAGADVTSTGLDQGAAYVFLPTPGTTNDWFEFKKLSAPQPRFRGAFGNSVRISGGTILTGERRGLVRFGPPVFDVVTGLAHLYMLDDDGDGIPDSADTDDDNDGMPDDAEVAADTNPFSATSILKLTSIEVTPTNTYITWEGGLAATQHIQCSTSMASPVWETIYTNRPPTLTNHMDRSLSATGPQFYRLRIP